VRRRGRGPSGTTVARAEPLTTLTRSARSRVSLVAPLSPLCPHPPPTPCPTSQQGWAAAGGHPRAILCTRDRDGARGRPTPRCPTPDRECATGFFATNRGAASTRSLWGGRCGCTHRRRSRERPRRPVSEQSERTLLGAPTSDRRRRRGHSHRPTRAKM
jgi:hypothetical protein